jgi:hypothetical protein
MGVREYPALPACRVGLWREITAVTIWRGGYPLRPAAPAILGRLANGGGLMRRLLQPDAAGRFSRRRSANDAMNVAPNV